MLLRLVVAATCGGAGDDGIGTLNAGGPALFICICILFGDEVDDDFLFPSAFERGLLVDVNVNVNGCWIVNASVLVFNSTMLLKNSKEHWNFIVVASMLCVVGYLNDIEYECSICCGCDCDCDCISMSRLASSCCHHP